jgi:putative flippase GtrA
MTTGAEAGPDGAADLGIGRRLGVEALCFAGIGLSAALGFVVLSGAMVALFHSVPAAVVSTICYAMFIVPTYLAHRRFSFRTDAPHRQALPRYMAVQALGLLLAALFSYLAYDIVRLPSLPASILVIGLTSGVNFILLRAWAFASAGRSSLGAFRWSRST